MQFNQEAIAEKAKEFISRHKGKLAAAAGLTLLGGAGLLTAGGLGYIGYLIGKEEANRAKKENINQNKKI